MLLSIPSNSIKAMFASWLLLGSPSLGTTALGEQADQVHLSNAEGIASTSASASASTTSEGRGLAEKATKTPKATKAPKAPGADTKAPTATKTPKGATAAPSVRCILKERFPLKL
eukprot:Nitzschia sp. Nitz4//scaffold340_size24592//21663//22440//NITZ4_008364-RA/size24592-processed-gene-0.8-mRNA-1//-1//CDS//3329548524//9259//frame0